MLSTIFVYRGTATGQELLFQSVSASHTGAGHSFSFPAASCPGKQDPATNPLGYSFYDSLGHVQYYQEESSVWQSEDNGDIALLLTVSSILIHLNMVEPHPARSSAEDPVHIKVNQDFQ